MVTRDTTAILLLVCLIGGLQAKFASEPRDVVVKMGGRATMNCRHSKNIIEGTCSWTPPTGNPLFILVSHPQSSKYQPFQEDGRDCGLTVLAVTEEDNGKWLCAALGVGDTDSSTAEVNITVAVPPTSIKLQSGTAGMELNLKEGDEVDFKCEVQHARPEPAIYWYIGDDRITRNIKDDVKFVDYRGFVDVSQNMTYHADPKDAGKEVKCVYFHEAYDSLKDNKSAISLDIEFRPVDHTYGTLYQFVLGKTQDIKVNISANPRPRVVWHMRGQVAVAEGTSSPDGKYTAHRLERVGLGTWLSVMTVQNLGEADAGKGVEHLLEVENKYGARTYKIGISDLEAPPEGVKSTGEQTVSEGNQDTDSSISTDQHSLYRNLSGDPLTIGAIAGIVIGILLVIFIVFVIVYARRAGMWCFTAKGDDKQQSSSQAQIDTENPGLPAEGTENPTANHAQPDGSTENVDHQTEAVPEIKTDMNGKKDDKDTAV